MWGYVSQNIASTRIKTFSPFSPHIFGLSFLFLQNLCDGGGELPNPSCPLPFPTALKGVRVISLDGLIMREGFSHHCVTLKIREFHLIFALWAILANLVPYLHVKIIGLCKM